jgi:hypothetical protein
MKFLTPQGIMTPVREGNHTFIRGVLRRTTPPRAVAFGRATCQPNWSNHESQEQGQGRRPNGESQRCGALAQPHSSAKGPALAGLFLGRVVPAEPHGRGHAMPTISDARTMSRAPGNQPSTASIKRGRAGK